MRLKLVCLKRIEDILSAIGLPILYYIWHQLCLYERELSQNVFDYL